MKDIAKQLQKNCTQQAKVEQLKKVEKTHWKIGISETTVYLCNCISVIMKIFDDGNRQQNCRIFAYWLYCIESEYISKYNRVRLHRK